MIAIIDTLISKKQEKLDQYKIDMEAIRQQFIKATATFFAHWYNVTARHYIIRGSQNTLT
jgi:hypothetical protein